MSEIEMTATDGFKNLLAFCILIAGQEILNKAPSYIIEKYKRYCVGDINETNRWQWGLDLTNQHIMEQYLARWGYTS